MQLVKRFSKLRNLLFFTVQQPIIRIFVAVLVLLGWVFLSDYKSAVAGECLESKEQMLSGYKDQISQIADNPASSNTQSYSFGWIEYCWSSSEPNDEIDEKLGTFIISVAENPKVPHAVKIKNLEMARYTALSNLFPKMVELLKQGKDNTESSIIEETLINIWSTHAKTHPEIAQFNLIRLLKETSPEAPDVRTGFNCTLYWAMGKVYPFDYLAAKKLLLANNFFQPTKCNFGRTFQDPRAFEDAGYIEYNYKSEFSLDRSALFSSLIRHMELEFKRAWLDKVGAEQLRELRNGILATYGRQFKDRNLKYLFNSDYLRHYCRNGKCGKINTNYSNDLLTDIDKKNIDLIQDVEKNAPLTYPTIDPSRFPAPPPRPGAVP